MELEKLMVNGALMDKEYFEGNVEETRKHLLAYCKMDTLAMVEILKKLKLQRWID